MMVEVEVKAMYRLRLHNKDSAMGCYYGEDDWDIILYGDTVDELLAKAPDEVVRTRIVISSAYLHAVVVLCYKDHTFLLECDYNDVHTPGLPASVLEDLARMKAAIAPEKEGFSGLTVDRYSSIERIIKTSPRYIHLEAEYQARVAEEKRVKEEKRRADVIEAERRHYENLKKKYGETTLS